MTESIDDYLQMINAKVDEFGVAIQAVSPAEGSDEDLRWTYTVGLFAFGHPEFVIAGLPHRLAGQLLNDMAVAVMKSGMSFVPGERVYKLVQRNFGWLTEVADTHEYIGVAYEIRDRREPQHRGMELSALQILFADADGNWPWEEASAIPDSVRFGDVPQLGPEQHLPAAEDRRRAGW